LYTGKEDLKVVFATHLNQPQIYWQGEYNFEVKASKFEQLLPLVCIKEVGVDGNILLTIVNDRFSGDDLQFMEKEAAYLEANGNATKRGELKTGTRMVTYGVRYARGHLSW